MTPTQITECTDEKQLCEAIREYVESGCFDVSDSLGIQKMPKGYALMLNADQTQFFWISTKAESCISWDKWAAYRGAKKDALAALNGEEYE